MQVATTDKLQPDNHLKKLIKIDRYILRQSSGNNWGDRRRQKETESGEG